MAHKGDNNGCDNDNKQTNVGMHIPRQWQSQWEQQQHQHHMGWPIRAATTRRMGVMTTKMSKWTQVCTYPDVDEMHSPSSSSDSTSTSSHGNNSRSRSRSDNGEQQLQYSNSGASPSPSHLCFFQLASMSGSHLTYTPPPPSCYLYNMQ